MFSAPFVWRTYWIPIAGWIGTLRFDAYQMGTVSVPFSVLEIGILFGFEYGTLRSFPEHRWRERIGLYSCAVILLFTTIAALASSRLSGMIRYHLGIHVLLVLAAVHLFSRLSSAGQLSGKTKMALVFALGLFLGLSFAAQLKYGFDFTHQRWVA